jgi:hypothetical protein
MSKYAVFEEGAAPANKNKLIFLSSYINYRLLLGDFYYYIIFI